MPRSPQPSPPPMPSPRASVSPLVPEDAVSCRGTGRRGGHWQPPLCPHGSLGMFYEARLPPRHRRTNLRPHPLARTFPSYPAHRGRRPILAETLPVGGQQKPTSSIWPPHHAQDSNSPLCHQLPSPCPRPAPGCHPSSATKTEDQPRQGLFSPPPRFGLFFHGLFLFVP